MTKENNQNKLKQIIDNLLLINLYSILKLYMLSIFSIEELLIYNDYPP